VAWTLDAGAEDAAADCVATVELPAADDGSVAVAELLAGMAGAVGGAVTAGVAEASGVAGLTMGLLESCCIPSLLLIVTSDAASAVAVVELFDVDVVSEVEVEVVCVVSVDVVELGAELVPCVELVADLGELVSDDVDELLAEDDDEESSAAATPWPVATAVMSHADTASPP
jgi:hypothetical protein